MIQSSSVRPNSPRSPRFLLANCLLVVVFMALIVVETVLTNSQVAAGSQSNQLYKQRTDLANQVSDLKRQVAQYKSLNYIQEYAQVKLKMEPLAKNILYLELPNEEQ